MGGDDRSALEWALDLAGRGFMLFPLPPGEKRPNIKWKDALTDEPAEIASWFADDPDSNYGVCPGERFAVVDLDVKGDENGVKAFAELEEQHGGLHSLTVETPSGGVHIYVEVPDPVGNAHSFPSGIDVRGRGGYVVGPGSRVNDAPYSVVSDEDVARAPTWVVARMKGQRNRDKHVDEPIFDLDSAPAVKRAKEFLRTRLPAIEGQGGDEHTYVTAGMVKDFGVSEEKCLEIMLEPRGWNDRCDPPWEPGELARKVSNAYEYGQRRPGAKGGGSPEEAFGDLGGEAEDFEEPGDGFDGLREITFRGTGLTRRGKRREMIVPEWMPAHGYTALLAKRGMGKTVAMVDMALRAACDMDWHGSPMKQDLVAVYLCGEDDEGLEEQMRAWCRENKAEPDEDRFIVLAGIVDLLSAESTETWTRYLMTLLEGRRAVLFVDTWQRATSRGTQNDDEEMQLAVHHAEAMARSLNGPAVIAFHPPKHAEHMVMGSSIIENSSTAIWQMTENVVGRKLEVTRIKGKGTGNYQLFEFKEVRLGEQDEFGREMSGVVPIKRGGVESAESQQERDERRGAYARLIRELEKYRMDPDYGTTQGKPYSVRDIYERVQALQVYETEQIDDDITERAEWAKLLLFDLSESGVRNLGRNSFSSDITQLLVNDPTPFDFGDGHTLRPYKDGKAHRFRIEVKKEEDDG